jgi:hypothetical protein
MDASLQPLEALAQWSHWLPLADAAASPSRSSGVYVARLGADGQLIYVGMAGMGRQGPSEGLRQRQRPCFWAWRGSARQGFGRP